MDTVNVIQIQLLKLLQQLLVKRVVFGNRKLLAFGEILGAELLFGHGY
jgi:hypothetical protein